MTLTSCHSLTMRRTALFVVEHVLHCILYFIFLHFENEIKGSNKNQHRKTLYRFMFIDKTLTTLYIYSCLYLCFYLHNLSLLCVRMGKKPLPSPNSGINLFYIENGNFFIVIFITILLSLFRKNARFGKNQTDVIKQFTTKCHNKFKFYAHCLVLVGSRNGFKHVFHKQQ